MPLYTAFVSLLAIVLYIFFGTRVAAVRQETGVNLPAVTGHPLFERVYRVQMNTLEWMPNFLVPLWVCAVYFSDLGAAVLGLVWIVGRFLYYRGYREATEKRLPGFVIQAFACLLLLIGAFAGVLLQWAGVGMPWAGV